MTMFKLMVVLGGALFVSYLEMALMLSLAPDLLKLTRYLILPRDWTMEVSKDKSGDHRPGEQGLTVMGFGPGETRDVKWQALLAAWIFLFFEDLVSGFALAWVLWQ